MARASGWFDRASSAAAAPRSAGASPEAETVGRPSVIVPVLSATTMPTSRAVWIASALRMISPSFDAAPVRTEPSPIEVESLSESTQELIDRSIAELLSARGLDVASLGQSDRVDVIRHLNGNGVFMLKGAVACAATALRPPAAVKAAAFTVAALTQAKGAA